MSKERLQRIEDKVDEMGQAILALARMEEKVITIFKRLDNMEDSFKKFDERMDEAEKQAIARGQKIAFAERIFWMICTGAVGLAFVYLR